MDGMKFFDASELERIDFLLKDIEHESPNNDELVSRLSNVRLAFKKDISFLSSLDPFSNDYKNIVMKIFEEISGVSYSRNNEGLPVINSDYEKDWPYPWGTKSYGTVARFLISYGYLIKIAALPPHARILEVGCGLGSLTWNLSRMGYRVDAIDPNEIQCQCVVDLTKDMPVRPNVVHMTLSEWLAEKQNNFHYKYDAIIFFESFHHLPNHLDDLAQIIQKHLEFNGQIILAAEPIIREKCDAIPYAWGPRLDGESIRAMRKWGWLELGFQESYIEQMFSRLGMTYSLFHLDEAAPWSRIAVGRLKSGPLLSSFGHDKYPAIIEEGFDLSRVGVPSFIENISGIGEREVWGRWTIGEKVLIEFKNALPKNFQLIINVADVYGPNVHRKLHVKTGLLTESQVLKEIGLNDCYEFFFKNVKAKTIELIIPAPSRPKDNLDINNEDPRFIGIAIKKIRIIPCED